MKNRMLSVVVVMMIAIMISACGPNEMQVDLSADVTPNKGFPTVVVTSNLPDDTVVGVDIYPRSYGSSGKSQHDQVVIKNGVAEITLDNYGKGFPNDEYNVRLTVIPGDQNEEIKKAMGDHGENLKEEKRTRVTKSRDSTPEYNYAYLNVAVDIMDSEVVMEEVPSMPSSTSTETPERAIENYVWARVLNYDNTLVDEVRINEDLGTDVEGDYIALVNLTWNVQNSAETTEMMLQMYSDDLAASLAIDHPEVQEAAIFWNVPYLGSNTSKWSYERRGNGMYATDKVLGF